MNLRSVDLNLLVVLDALLDEAHVSRAAERVGLSQPAASSALERCRQLFANRLLERGRGTMRLTPKAQSLQQPIKDLLAQMTALIDPPAPDLSTLHRTVRMVTADLPPTVLAGELYARLAQAAPGITLALLPWHGAGEALEALARGSADLAVSVFPTVEKDFIRKELLQERYVVAMRRGHPAAENFDLDRWLTYRHVLISGRGESFGALDEALGALGRSRRIGLVVPSFLLVPPLLLGSDLIALLPSRTLPPDAGEHFVTFEPPIPVAGFALQAAWHRRNDRDPAVQYVARLVETVLGAAGA